VELTDTGTPTNQSLAGAVLSAVSMKLADLMLIEE
jgi:hypothetical protein